LAARRVCTRRVRTELEVAGMNGVKRASFVVRVVQDEQGRVNGIIER
jgi:hypothetical protein